MSRNIKSLKKLHSLIGKTVHVVGYNGHEFDAQVTDGVTHGLSGKYSTLLYTTDKAAEDEIFWWKSGSKPHEVPGKGDRWGHVVKEKSQLTEELKSVTTTKDKAKAKVNKTTKTFVSAEDLKANVGHYCEMADGSTGLIAGSVYLGNICVLHNSEDSEGWIISKFTRKEEIKGVQKSLIQKFSRGWHVGCDDEAKQVKVVKILDEVFKCKKAKQKTDPKTTDFQVDESKKSFLTRKQLLENIGKHCKMSDGTEGFIVRTNLGNPRILMSSEVNGYGWPYDEKATDDTGAPSSIKIQYKFAWNVCDDGDAEDISVVEILDDDKSEEPSKTILDMTVREVLEKLNEIIISR